MQKCRTAELVCRHGMALESCSNCQPSLPHEKAVQEVALHIGEIVEAARPRVLTTPTMMGTYAGQDAIRSRLLDLTSGERLTIMTHPHTFQVMATMVEA